MLRFRLFGIPFEISPYFWLGSILLGGLGRDFTSKDALLRLAVWVGCVFVSIVAHELGHALVGRRYGARPQVVLHGMGGVTFLPGAYFTRGRSILVSLAGPAFGFALFFLVQIFIRTVDLQMLNPGSLGNYLLVLSLIYLSFINGFWTLFNLLPILPLDGGQVCRDVLGPSRFHITRLIGATVGAIICVLAAMNGQIFIAIFLGFLAYSNFKGDTRTIPGGVDKP
jgi:stage IV sporulation protein FB